MIHPIIYSFASYLFISAITPGPNNTVVHNTALQYGIKQAMPYALGVIVGAPLVMYTVIVLGGSFFERYATLALIAKYVGCAYLLFLAYKLAFSQPNLSKANYARPLSFWQSITFQLLNPKLMSGALTLSSKSALVQVINPLWQFSILAVIHAGCIFIGVSLWILLGAFLGKLLKQKPTILRVYNQLMGLALAFVVVKILLY